MLDYMSAPSNKNTRIDPVTLLANVALMPCYPKGTRIGFLKPYKVTIQESYKYIDTPYLVVDQQALSRMKNGNGRDEACIFHKTITEGIKENQFRTDFHRLCHLAQEGLIQYIKPYEDEEDNASIVFDVTMKALVNYCNQKINNPEKFIAESTQKWDDKELHDLVNYIESAKNEATNKETRPARSAAIKYLEERHVEIEPKLQKEFEVPK